MDEYTAAVKTMKGLVVGAIVGAVIAEKSKPSLPPPLGPLLAPAFNALPKRCDQTQCPRCSHYGCPRVGSYLRLSGMTRYRKCSACGHTFETFALLKTGPGGGFGAERVLTC